MWLGFSLASDASRARWAAVVSSSSSTITSAKRSASARADVRALAQEPVEGEEDVAAVEAAGLGEDAVVGRGDELGELAASGASRRAP